MTATSLISLSIGGVAPLGARAAPSGIAKSAEHRYGSLPLP